MVWSLLVLIGWAQPIIDFIFWAHMIKPVYFVKPFDPVAAAVATFFSAAWFFTPLDLDSHSATTKLVFIFAPVFSLGFAIIASGVAWIVARAK